MYEKQPPDYLKRASLSLRDAEFAIVDKLIKEGYEVEEGWSHEICLEILLRLDQRHFDVAVKLAQDYEHCFSYHNDYLRAIEVAIIARPLGLT